VEDIGNQETRGSIEHEDAVNASSLDEMVAVASSFRDAVEDSAIV
jgi:hypothetical protein